METKERREGRRRGAGEEQDFDDKGEAMKTRTSPFLQKKKKKKNEEEETTTTTGETASGERMNICSKNESHHRGEKCRHHHRRGPFLGGMPAFGADVFVVRANI